MDRNKGRSRRRGKRSPEGSFKQRSEGVRERIHIVLDWLRSQGDPGRAEQSRRFFRQEDAVAFYGVPTPALRRYAAQLFREVRESWSIVDALAFCDHLLADARLEAKALGILVLHRFHSAFPLELMERIRSWLERDRCANWATADLLCSEILAPYLQRYPEKISLMIDWARASNLWVRRAAAVSLARFARRGKRLDVVYAVAERLLDADHDLLHKANGWLLREAGKADAKRLERFLLHHGPRIPRTTLRYAIERFPEPRRKDILRATRTPS